MPETARFQMHVLLQMFPQLFQGDSVNLDVTDVFYQQAMLHTVRLYCIGRISLPRPESQISVGRIRQSHEETSFQEAINFQNKDITAQRRIDDTWTKTTMAVPFLVSVGSHRTTYFLAAVL